MWIMVAGPYRSGTSTDAERAENLRDAAGDEVASFTRRGLPVFHALAEVPSA